MAYEKMYLKPLNSASRDTLHEIRNTSDNLCQIMQNKPNFRKAEMKLSFYLTRGYENEPHPCTLGKQTQTKPISNVTLLKWVITSYEAPLTWQYLKDKL